jgi:glycosyltransferase involved in cell wall biosynthesis
MRIGLVTPAWPGTVTANGIASATAQLAIGLHTIGHEVTTVALHADAPTSHPRVVLAPDSGMTLFQRLLYRFDPDQAIRQRVVGRLVAAARLAIDRHGVEVLMMEESFGWAAAVRRQLSIPVIVTLHGPHWLHRSRPGSPQPGLEARKEAWEAAGLRAIDGIISPSRDVLDRTRAEWGLPEVPMTVIGNPVNVGQAVTPAADGDEPHLLFVGRFDRIKGGDLLLEAFADIAARHATCRLTLVGPDNGVAQPDGTTRHLAEALAALPPATRDRIEVLGHRDRDEIAGIRCHHPITLITSRYETFGVALVEAMAAGSAVVSTRVGGCAEILVDGKTGLLVPPENPSAIADACLRLLGDSEFRRRLGSTARADAAARFSPEGVAREVAAFLAPLCPGRS